MTSAEIESMIDRSFLSRVPLLINAGMSYDEALRHAFKDDEKLIFALLDIHHYSDARFSRTLPNPPLVEARSLICERVYSKNQMTSGLLQDGAELK